MNPAVSLAMAVLALSLAGLLHADAADAPWHVPLGGQVRTDLPAVSPDGATWNWSY